jgi:hypothetical protein
MARKGTIQRTIIIKVDQRGAVAAIKGLERSNKRAFAQIKRAVEGGTRPIDRYKASVTSISVAFLAVQSAARLFGRAISGVISLMDQAAAQNSGIRQMGDAFQRTGLDIEDSTAALELFADEMQATSKFGDDETRKIATQFATMTRGVVSDTGQIIAATGLIQDAATRLGRSSERVTRQMATVFGGNLEGLKSLLPGQDALVDRLMIMDDQAHATALAVQELNNSFFGASTNIDSAEASMWNARNTLGDFKESMGDLGILMLIDTGIVQGMTDTLGFWSEAVTHATGRVRDLNRATGGGLLGTAQSFVERGLEVVGEVVTEGRQLPPELGAPLSTLRASFDVSDPDRGTPLREQLQIDEEALREHLRVRQELLDAQSEAAERAAAGDRARREEERERQAQRRLLGGAAGDIGEQGLAGFGPSQEDIDFITRRKDALVDSQLAIVEALNAEKIAREELSIKIREQGEVEEAAAAATAMGTLAAVNNASAIASSAVGLLGKWKGAKRLEFAISAAGEIAKGFATAAVPGMQAQSALHFLAAAKFGVAAAMAGGGGGGGGGGSASRASSGGGTSSTADTLAALRPEAARSGRQVTVIQQYGAVFNTDETRRFISRARDEAISLGEAESLSP